MAIRYAVVNGSWSSVATWDGGVSLPTVGDDVYANGFIVTVDQDIEVNKISTEVCPITSVGAGEFNVGVGIWSLTCDIVAGTYYCLKVLLYNTTIVLIGDIYGGTATNAWGIFCASYAILTMTGNIIGGSGTNAHGIYRVGSSRTYDLILDLVGNVIASNGGGIYSETGYINGTIVGSITGGLKPGVTRCEAIHITGNIIAGNSYGVAGSGYAAAILTIDGNLEFTDGNQAWCLFLKTYLNVNPTTIIKMSDSSLNSHYLYSASAFDQPGEENVRLGTSYASATLTGTCAVPDAENVVRGVPVDNTTGLYELSGDIITRLEHCSTVATTGEQVAGFDCGCE